MIMAPFTWLGRVLLWVFLFPVGVWRSLRHHRKKGERRSTKQMEKMLDERERKK
jgi:fatty acid desaturase